MIESIKTLFDTVNKLNKDVVSQCIASLAWYLPILFVTNKIYLHFYGEYEIIPNGSYLLKFFFTSKPYFTLLFFSCIFHAALLLNNYAIPFIFMRMTTVRVEFNKEKETAAKILKESEGKDILKNTAVVVDKIGQRELYKFYAYLPTIIFSWSVYIMTENLCAGIGLFILNFLVGYLVGQAAKLYIENLAERESKIIL